jgi:hypothetical protein
LIGNLIGNLMGAWQTTLNASGRTRNIQISRFLAAPPSHCDWLGRKSLLGLLQREQSALKHEASRHRRELTFKLVQVSRGRQLHIDIQTLLDEPTLTVQSRSPTLITLWARHAEFHGVARQS